MATAEIEGFVRQRRNLMIGSLVLLFSEVTQLQIDKLSVFGTELTIGKPQAITNALWVAVFYWLIRYYQYARQTYPGAIKSAMNSRVRETAKASASNQIKIERKHSQKRNKALPQIKTPVANIRAHYPNCLLLNVSYEFEVQNGEAIVPAETVNVEIKGIRLFVIKVKALLHTALHTTVLTEVVLPYIIFTLPLAYALYLHFTK